MKRVLVYNHSSGHGSACSPVIAPVFKTGGRRVNPVFGAFDSHTLPPCIFISLEASIPPDIDPLKAQITLIVMKL